MPRRRIPRPCGCGCVGATFSEFRPGHDMVYRSRLLQEARGALTGNVTWAVGQAAVQELRRRGWHYNVTGLPTLDGVPSAGAAEMPTPRRRTGSSPSRAQVRSARGREIGSDIDPAVISRLLRDYSGVLPNDHRYFGVEIEFFGIHSNTVSDALTRAGIECQNDGYTHRVLSCWKVVPDRSVRAQGTGLSAHGLELVSPPLLGLGGMAELREVCRILGTLQAKVDRTCGLHVHHDIEGLEPRHVRGLVSFYTHLQPTINLLMPTSRHDNQYCTAWSEYDMERMRTMRSMEMLADSFTRYHHVNLTSLQNYGTVEFRQHSGTIDFDKISHWVMFGQRMIDRARENAPICEDNMSAMLSWLNFNEMQTDWFRNRADKLRTRTLEREEQARLVRAAEAAEAERRGTAARERDRMRRRTTGPASPRAQVDSFGNAVHVGATLQQSRERIMRYDPLRERYLVQTPGGDQYWRSSWDVMTTGVDSNPEPIPATVGEPVPAGSYIGRVTSVGVNSDTVSIELGSRVLEEEDDDWQERMDAELDRRYLTARSRHG